MNANQRTLDELESVGRDGEAFTATVDCPHCGHLAVHWIDRPRVRPEVESPSERAMRMISESIWSLALFSGGPPRRFYDPDGTVVARECVKCGYRWGQV